MPAIGLRRLNAGIWSWDKLSSRRFGKASSAAKSATDCFGQVQFLKARALGSGLSLFVGLLPGAVASDSCRQQRTQIGISLSTIFVYRLPTPKREDT